jgi:hypothetical protein
MCETICEKRISVFLGKRGVAIPEAVGLHPITAEAQFQSQASGIGGGQSGPLHWDTFSP